MFSQRNVPMWEVTEKQCQDLSWRIENNRHQKPHDIVLEWMCLVQMFLPYDYCTEFARESAHSYWVLGATDPTLLARAWINGIVSAICQKYPDQLAVSFPFMDIRTVPSYHVDLGDDAKPIGNQPTQNKP